ncbi:MAG: FkbM family methyltransferase [Candidatus Omnitrophica bacterium]|nr:FkbM family methyltransferase [Candidatus Omnitrophota bacterium]
MNIRDNIYRGSLRDSVVEKKIGRAREPVIVDCGVNVGITVRWWLYLNPGCRVYGIDMMQEAQDFTVKSLPERLKKNYTPITAALDFENGRAVEVKYDDPLFGGNSLSAEGKFLHTRGIRSVTIDSCIRTYNIKTIELLKIDIELSAERMLYGAAETLGKVRNILLEWHHEEKERKGSVLFLQKTGFRIRREYKRHIWFEKI